MYIKEIQFVNFRFFENNTFDDFSKFNVIIGDNGTGKTSFIKGLNIGMSSFFKAIQEVSKQDFEKHDIRINYDNMHPKYCSGVSIITTLLHNDIEYAISRSLDKKGGETITSGDSFLDLVKSMEHDIIDNKNSDLPVLVYYPATRDSMEITIPISDTIKDLLKIKDPVKNYKDFLKWYAHQTKTNEKFIGYFNATKPTTNSQFFLHWFKKISLESKTSELAKIKLEFTKKMILKCLDTCKEVSYSQTYDIILLTQTNDTVIPINRLSDGYKRILSIIGDIAFRCITLNPHLKMSANECKGIVLIDELDLHLHPNWQKQIVNHLAELFPNLQFFVSTHSPFIIQEITNGNLILLNTDEVYSINDLNYSIEDIAENLQGVKNPQWSKKRVKMFEAAKKYYALLDELSDEKSSSEIEHLKDELDELTKPFADNLAYVAFLEQERMVKEFELKNKKS